MQLSNQERETIILFNEAESCAEIYTFNPALQKQLSELCRSHPENVKLTHQGAHGSMEFQIPKKWLRVVPPRVLSPAQRAVIDRMNESRRRTATE